MSSSATAYLQLPADDRQELRLPALLKQHAAAVAQSRGQSVTQYIMRLVAEHVSAELPETRVWTLTLPEFESVMRALVPRPESPELASARARAIELFGPE
jgi:uncharacterized protein (DUF1778 family)